MSTLNRASDIAQEVALRLANITVANGFVTEIGSNVMRGRRRIDDEQVPCVVLVEGADSVTPGPGRIPTSEIRQSYVLVAYHNCNPDHPNDKAHDLIRDMKRAVFADGVTLGGKVLKVEYKGRDIGPRGDGVPIVMATIEVEVRFTENLTDP